jgi:hypothetical protein
VKPEDICLYNSVIRPSDEVRFCRRSLSTCRSTRRLYIVVYACQYAYRKKTKSNFWQTIKKANLIGWLEVFACIRYVYQNGINRPFTGVFLYVSGVWHQKWGKTPVGAVAVMFMYFVVNGNFRFLVYAKINFPSLFCKNSYDSHINFYRLNFNHLHMPCKRAPLYDVYGRGFSYALYTCFTILPLNSKFVAI